MKPSPAPFSLLAAALLAALSSCATAGPVADATKPINFDDYVLTGRYANGEATFTLHARAQVSAKTGGEAVLVSGPISLTTIPEALSAKLDQHGDAVMLKSASDLTVDLPFRAQIKEADGWKTLQFTPAAANIRQLVLEGWPDSAKLELPDASQAVRQNGRVTVNLPGSGPVILRWKDAPPEGTGRLFFSVDGAVINTLAPGILRQSDQLTYRVLQGKLDRLELDLFGAGEVTRVEGAGILNWSVAPGAANGPRKLIVQLNAPQTGVYQLTVQLETTLAALPTTATPPRLAPLGASSYGGRVRVQNEGAVRLEVSDIKGLSQIAPEQFPVTRSAGAPPSVQAFAYRFADSTYTYTVRADNVLPEVSVEGIVVYHLGDTDMSLETELQLDIREAPLRELNILGPADWSVAGLEAPNLADYFLTPAEGGRARLRLLFAQPLLGRQVVRVRLERNAAAITGANGTWQLPPLSVVEAKSARGFVGVTADASLRLTTTASDGLNEAGPSTFPANLNNLQASWRFNDAPWSATLRVERLASSIQSDALQLFSVGEGLAYGSTVINLNIAGAPVSTLRVRNTGNYRNVEFTGRNLRNWKQNGDVYEVYLNRPVSGAYTLLATYELPFKATGDTLPFTGFQPLDVQSEQGHVLVTSAHPFSIAPTNVTSSLTRLDGPEVPAEYKLLSDAPILACYQYSARPFDASLQLQPLADSGTVDQVVDIAELQTRVSTTGEIHTTAKYLLKSKSHDHLQATLPKGARLWSVRVAGADVVPVSDKTAAGATADPALLIPLPRQGDPNSPLLVELEYVSVSPDAGRVTVGAPVVHAPVLVTDWILQADQDHELRALQAAPLVEAPRLSGLGWLGQVAFGETPKTSPITDMISPANPGEATSRLWRGLIYALASVICLRLARRGSLFIKLVGAVGGLVLGAMALMMLVNLGLDAPGNIGVMPAEPEMRLSVPVLQANTVLSYELANAETPKSSWSQPFSPLAWLLLPGIILIIATRRKQRAGGTLQMFAGWLLLLAGALALPHGPLCFSLVLAALLGWLILRALWNLARASMAELNDGGAASAAAATVVLFAIWFAMAPASWAANAAAPPAPAPAPTPKPGLVLSLTQNGTVQDNFVRMSAEISWRAEKGDQLKLLGAPAVLTAFAPGKADISLGQSAETANMGYIVTANSAGTYKFSFSYQVRAPESAPGTAAVTLPTPGGLVNEVNLDLARMDIEGGSDNAVALRTIPGAGGKPRVVASFAPGASPMVRWWPRARDLSTEKPVYYAEWQQLYTPAAGIVDGRHEVQIRLAQGEIKELSFSVPANTTISNVQAEGLAAWRFDPDQHKLLTYFEPARKNPFSIAIFSQTSAAPLPYTATLSPIRLDGSANEVGLLATATSQEVQLGAATPQNLAAINLDDFPARLVQAMAPRGETYNVRRAYSYGGADATLKVEALAVEPDVRVDSVQTLSLGEDRVVLAARLNVNVARAGIFNLSFALPPGLDLESISGQQLSHWTESGPPEARIVTLNLKGKSMGSLQFNVTLSGPGLSRRQNWTAPRLSLRGAAKETGQLALLPELGLRPHILTREGLTQIDPREARINAEGALVFRLLQSDWSLSFDVETIEPSIQTDVLQDVTLREALTEVRANINYQIDNAGVRELRLQLPEAAMGVRISGAQVGDSLPVEGQPGRWLVRLQRRSIGALRLNLTYQLPPAGADNRASVTGIQTLDTTLQRGYVDLRSRGRLETRVTNAPLALQATDWESVPQSLRSDLEGGAPSQIYRVVDPLFTLPVEVVRHEAAEVLPARVVAADLRSMVSPDGQVLTAVTVSLFPGSKRHLNLTLPTGAKFWFAFVNDKGVTPSVDSASQGGILLPLEPNPLPDQPATVEFLYEQTWPGAGSKANLAGPRFDLPLANISWKLFLPESWKVRDWSGPWQKVDEPPLVAASSWQSLSDYQSSELRRQAVTAEKAENFRREGTRALQQGQQMQARELFSNAYQISQRDTALNEDARVQWQNLREQQAMVALNNNANTFNGRVTVNGGVNQPGAIQPAANPVLSQTEVLNFTDEDARKLLGANAAEDNAVLAKLAQRLVKQQAATLPRPVAIHATLPQRGQVYDFTQSLLVNPRADLSLQVNAGPANRPLDWAGVGALAILALGAAAAAKLARRPAAAA